MKKNKKSSSTSKEMIYAHCFPQLMAIGPSGLMENVTGIVEQAKSFTDALVPTRNLKEMGSPALERTILQRSVT